MNRTYLNNSFLYRYSELVEELGGVPSELCSAAGLADTVLYRDNQVISFQAFIHLLNLTEKTLSVPAFPILLAARQDIHILGPIARLLSQSKSVREAFHGIAGKLHLIASDIHMDIVESDDTVELMYSCDSPSLERNKSFQNYLLAATLLVLRSLLNTQQSLRGCYFRYVPGSNHDARAMNDFFRCPIKYDSDDIKISFSKSVFDERIYAHNEGGKNLRVVRPTTQDIEKILGIMLPTDSADLRSIAIMTGCSDRTLIRVLEKEGTNFRKIKNSVVIQYANQYLRSPQLSLGEIARLTGFSHQSAFSRSYLKLTGQTPLKYRQGLKTSD